jgi:Glycoside hydrolase family 2 C-terminal domain 5
MELSNGGRLAAVCSGAPQVMESFRQPQYSAWHGRVLAIPRPLDETTGRLTLRATADGLSAGEIRFALSRRQE